MATDKEVTFPVESFVGVGQQVDREDKTARHFQNLENLWEKEIGILETRHGSEDFFKTLPVGVTGLDNIHKLYKSNGETIRIAAIHTGSRNVAIPLLATFPMISFSQFVDTSTTDEANWSEDFATGAGTVRAIASKIIMRLCGYGIDLWIDTGESMLILGQPRVLRMVIASSVAASSAEVTTIEMYAVHDIGKAELLWFGSVDLLTNPTGTFDFRQGPFGNLTVPAATDLQTTRRSFTLEEISGGGSFKKGQTILVQVMAQRMLIGSGGFTSKTISCWRQAAVPQDEIVSITISEDNASIKVNNLTPVTFSAIVAAGESIQTMVPVKTMGFNPVSGGKELQATITSIPKHQPGLVDLKQDSSFRTFFQYKFSDFSTEDMLARIDDDGNMFPIFISRLSRFLNDGDSASTVRNSSTKLVIPKHQEFLRIWRGNSSDLYPGIIDGFTWTARGFVLFPVAGQNSKWKFASYSNLTENLVFMVNDFDVNAKAVEGLKEIPFPGIRQSAYQHGLPRSGSNLFVTDGNIAGVVVHDVQDLSTPPSWLPGTDYVLGDIVFHQQDHFEAIEVSGPTSTLGTAEEPPSLRFWRDINSRLPSTRFIAEFENSIVVGGGQTTTDVTDNSRQEASSVIYFSRVNNPFEFTDAASASFGLNFIVIPTQEEILGMNLYTNTSGTDGPIQQLLIGKKNSLWVQSTLSVATATLINLSKKAGLVSHLSIVNTPIGTMIAAVDNIYLLRGTGEPVPVGNEISRIFERSNLANAVASYHDQHYKISFHDPLLGGSEDFNNVEWWLDIRKMKAQKGLSSWKGPMTGRVIDYSFVEDFAPDGISYENARDRLVVDLSQDIIYKADTLTDKDADQAFDLGVPVSIKLETKDFEISPKDNNFNKLITRHYWKVKTNHPNLIANEQTFVDGILIEEKDIKIDRGDIVNFEDQPLRITTIFPEGRPRGRTVRKVLTTDKRIGIGGFALLYKVERRRI